MADLPVVAVLGTGIMGGPMAGHLLDRGFDLRVWNRTASKAQGLVDRGATLASSPAEAATSAEFVITMLADGPTVHTVMDGVLDSMADGAVWIQMSTIGIEHTDRFAAAARDAGVAFVDAPVLGTRAPAESGDLVVLESGPAELSQRCAPLFDAVGSRVVRVGEAGAATRLKLVANNWVLAVTNATAECVALARNLDVEPQLFFDSVKGGALDLPYLHAKGSAMASGDYPLSFPLSLAAKDARLILDAAAGGADLSAARAALDHLERAEQRGHGNEDMAALYYGVVD